MEKSKFIADRTSRRWKLSLEEQGIFNLGIEEYFYAEFSQLRALDSISDLSMVHSFNTDANLYKIDERSVNPGGAGGGFIFFTFDKKLIIKSMRKSEFKVFSKLFPFYFNKLVSGEASFIARIYGVFKIRIKGVGVVCILFENILSSTYAPVKFDIKGSYINRRVANQLYQSIEEMPVNIVFKDTDFNTNVGHILLEHREWTTVSNRLMSDIKLFESQEVMDYSLLLAIQDIATDKGKEQTSKYRLNGQIHGKTYNIYIAIIDFFQEFTLKKKAELGFKSLKHKKTLVSSIPPTPYMLRFQEAISSMFITS